MSKMTDNNVYKKYMKIIWNKKFKLIHIKLLKLKK
jgi:hypothetical protein